MFLLVKGFRLACAQTIYSRLSVGMMRHRASRPGGGAASCDSVTEVPLWQQHHHHTCHYSYSTTINGSHYRGHQHARIARCVRAHRISQPSISFSNMGYFAKGMAGGLHVVSTSQAPNNAITADRMTLLCKTCYHRLPGVGHTSSL